MTIFSKRNDEHNFLFKSNKNQFNFLAAVEQKKISVDTQQTQRNQ